METRRMVHAHYHLTSPLSFNPPSATSPLTYVAKTTNIDRRETLSNICGYTIYLVNIATRRRPPSHRPQLTCNDLVSLFALATLLLDSFYFYLF